MTTVQRFAPLHWFFFLDVLLIFWGPLNITGFPKCSPSWTPQRIAQHCHCRTEEWTCPGSLVWLGQAPSTILKSRVQWTSCWSTCRGRQIIHVFRSTFLKKSEGNWKIGWEMNLSALLAGLSPTNRKQQLAVAWKWKNRKKAAECEWNSQPTVACCCCPGGNEGCPHHESSHRVETFPIDERRSCSGSNAAALKRFLWLIVTVIATPISFHQHPQCWPDEISWNFCVKPPGFFRIKQAAWTFCETEAQQPILFWRPGWQDARLRCTSQWIAWRENLQEAMIFTQISGLLVNRQRILGFTLVALLIQPKFQPDFDSKIWRAMATQW